MSTKGDWSRVQEHDQYRENFDRIFNKDRTRAAYDEGIKARREGKTLAGCPYKEEKNNAAVIKAWIDGWFDGEYKT